VEFPELGAGALVAWRMGMAQLAPFVAQLDDAARAALEARARQLLGTPPPLVRSIIIISGCVD
jgi:hypothetical protein